MFHDVQIQRRQQQFVAGVSVATAMLGALVLLGWITGSDLLKSVIPGQHGMKPNTALCFLLIGASLAAACRTSAGARFASSLTAAFAAAIGLVTLYEFDAQVDLGFDHWLGLTDTFDAASLFPGRMAPGTAAHFLLLGLAQLCRPHRRLHLLANALAGLSFFAALMPIAGFLFSAGVPRYSAMTLPTSIGVAIASLGVWTAAAPQNFPQQFFAPGLVGQISRCLLPMAVALPLVIGLVVFAFRNVATFDVSFGLAIMTVGNIVFFSLLCAWSARHIATSVAQRCDAENELAESLQRLKAEAEQRRNLVRQRVVEQTLLAREEEQRRIARDLHDGLGQLLTSLRFGLSGIENAVSIDAIHERVPLLRSQLVLGQAEIRRIIHDLRPATLDELGLAPALGQLTADFARDHNVLIRLDAAEVSRQRLPPPQETAIFRIVQEALNNVARHAAASEVTVAVHRRSTRVELRVSDNGRGLTAPLTSAIGRTGFGLLSMSERAALLAGEFRIGPSKPQGTTIEVVLPVDA